VGHPAEKLKPGAIVCSIYDCFPEIKNPHFCGFFIVAYENSYYLVGSQFHLAINGKLNSIGR
jgi:hypothetical protein